MKEDSLQRRSALLALLVTSALLLALIISSGHRSLWPFAYWKMYAAVPAKPARRVTWQQLVVEDVQGRSHRIWPKDLFTLDDDGSPQPSGPALIRAVLREGKQQRAHQESLMRRVEDVLGRAARRVQVRELVWKVDFTLHPAFDRDKPLTEKVLLTLERGQ